MNATDTLLDWVSSTAPSELPVEVRSRARLAILDWLGAELAGESADGAHQIVDLVAHWGGAQEATVIATGERVPAHLAALANATCGRVWDLDDVLEHAFCHVGASVVPAALAIAETTEATGRRISGPDFLAAVTLGMEATCRIALAPKLGFSATGASRTFECGTFGATFAASRLLGLTGERARHAMGIALGTLCGTQQSYLSGTHMVGVGQGLSAQAAVLATVMAGRGITGSSPTLDVLEGRFGYYFTNHRGEYDAAPITAALGTEWQLLDTSVKPLYPCCKFTHTSIDATAGALDEIGASAEAIARIEVDVTDEQAFDLTCGTGQDRYRPRTLAAAQFSMPYIIATTAVHGTFGPEHVAPAALDDARVLALADRVVINRDVDTAGSSRAFGMPMPGHVTITLENGATAGKRVELARGHPRRPMSPSDITDKFLRCAGFGRPGWTGAADVVRLVDGIDDLESVGTLVTALRG